MQLMLKYIAKSSVLQPIGENMERKDLRPVEELILNLYNSTH